MEPLTHSRGCFKEIFLFFCGLKATQASSKINSYRENGFIRVESITTMI